MISKDRLNIFFLPPPPHLGGCCQGAMFVACWMLRLLVAVPTLCATTSHSHSTPQPTEPSFSTLPVSSSSHLVACPDYLPVQKPIKTYSKLSITTSKTCSSTEPSIPLGHVNENALIYVVWRFAVAVGGPWSRDVSGQYGRPLSACQVSWCGCQKTFYSLLDCRRQSCSFWVVKRQITPFSIGAGCPLLMYRDRLPLPDAPSCLVLDVAAG